MSGLRFDDKLSLELTMPSTFNRPPGTGPLCISTQAFRASLLSGCPSGTKTIRPSKRLALSQRLWVETLGFKPVGEPHRDPADAGATAGGRVHERNHVNPFRKGAS